MFGLPIITVRPSECYGSFQDPERFIPALIGCCEARRHLPLWQDGGCSLEWTHIKDAVEGILTAAAVGRPGQTYNIGSGVKLTQSQLIKRIGDHFTHKLEIYAAATPPGMCKRVALDSSRLKAMRWRPSVALAEGLGQTIDWYRAHPEWRRHFDACVNQGPAHDDRARYQLRS